ncbi:hypothetical protein TPHA_0A00370 [Tetrapisispora phaffii CBS 4417]|uniref:AB hydrolase-1 domain-containing protein n=1 Tax=Tetrapisispora phaffii (strain ATCC 24235 / CBS 4417 / NBRC 1672 / NRRL Y-8282 / UCD 70-5) TaxID=1071381 RepID=G8BMJ4_TETPH|nr:hypothetical protein TPHA_0A00370 [Tetrapisispora phaffii CBS 4417]CCE61122.1 hypothetical protein TPHA_0A00370 [Tetrapisispora phaffii CBS 4417]
MFDKAIALTKMIIGGISIVAAASLAGLYTFQNRLVYPSWAQNARNYVDTPDKYNLPYKRVILKTRDNIQLEAYDLHYNDISGDSKTTVLILCPNAGNIGYFLPIIEIFFRQFKTNVFIYSYRGYGNSTGSPTEKGLKIDADTAIEHLINDDFHKDKKLVLYGRSLGGANAIYIASKYKNIVDTVVLENTFLSIPKVIPHMLPKLKYVVSFCHEIWNSEKEISNCSSETPFLFLSGKKDEIVPPEHMKTLYQLCPSNKKQIFEFPKGFHNDTIIQDGYWDIIEKFLEENRFI